MKTMTVVALLCVLAVGCAQSVAPTPPSARKTTTPTSPELAPTPREKLVAAPIPAAPINPNPTPAGSDAEPLPTAPVADPSHTHKALNPEGTLLLELMPDPADPKKTKAVRVLVQTEVCLRQGFLEVLVCKTNTKEHEAILRTPVDARFIHSALIAAGGTPGTPVQFVNPKTDEIEYKPASGTKIAVTVHYRRDRKVHTHKAQEWIRDMKSKQPMAYDWVFAGSRFMKDPENPDRPPYYMANNGEVISISNFVDSMLELPVAVSQDNENLNFEVMPNKVPPLLSKVWLILQPIPDKKP